MQFNVWQSVKVVGQGEYEGRAGVVVRPDGAGFVVSLDEVGDKPKAIVTFEGVELVPLGM